ncbi:hypothetical protein M885DRAFT_508299 [Pelagophyceae sp. CCMP2097]|nr:hypothetical protein M885DRAFT_508299 [Pelagophyceae sp. CCMP2097]
MVQADSTDAYPPMAQDVFYIQGYLYKKTRDGRWQKRWFETTGCFLTYYKSKKMTKLLAALNLPQVGEIRLADDAADDASERGCVLSIHLNDRDYLLKAADAASAARWVEVLNQLKNNATANGDDAKGPSPDAVSHSSVGFTWKKAGRLLIPCGCCAKGVPMDD